MKTKERAIYAIKIQQNKTAYIAKMLTQQWLSKIIHMTLGMKISLTCLNVSWLHWKKKWSYFDLKSGVTGGTKIRPGIPSNWRIFESNWLDIESQFKNLLSISIHFSISRLQTRLYLLSYWKMEHQCTRLYFLAMCYAFDAPGSRESMIQKN